MISEQKVSVVMPCFNGSKFIEKQIISILNQTHKNIELIIVDDQSTDNTVDIVSSIAANNSKIRFYLNPVNLGFNKNFEKAMSLATGEFIALSDQDDIWLPEKIAELINSIGNNWLIFSNSLHIDECDHKLNDSLLENFSLERRSFKSIGLNNFVTGHTMLFRKEFLDFALPIPTDGYYDWWMGFIALYHKKIAYLDKHLTLYRLHRNSVIQQQERQVIDNKITRAFLNRHSTITNLSNFLKYRLLEDEDRKFLAKHYKVYSMKNKYLLPLILFYYVHFNDLFPETRKRKTISKTRWRLASIFAKER
ncbi:MAG: glycosyltransferase [Arcticibacter sp.]